MTKVISFCAKGSDSFKSLLPVTGFFFSFKAAPGGVGVLPIVDYTGRLHRKGGHL